MTETVQSPVPFLSRDEIESRATAVRKEHGLESIPIDPVILANRLGIKVHNAKFSDENIVGLELSVKHTELFMSTKWLEDFQDKITSCWEWHSPALQIGFRYVKPEQGAAFWEIWTFPAVQEIVGGKEDGETVWSGFNFDILEFMTDFEPDKE